MIKKLFTLALASLVLNLVCAAPLAAAGGKQGDDEKRAAKVKSWISKVGTGKEARVAVRLRDKTEVKGYVSGTSDEQFVLTDEQTGATTTLMYSQVEKVKYMPFLKTVTKKSLTTKNVAKSLAIGVGGALLFVVGVCVLSKRCSAE